MPAKLAYRFVPTTDLYLSLVAGDFPDTQAWASVRAALDRYLTTFADAGSTHPFAGYALHGEIAEATDVEELEQRLTELPLGFNALGLPWHDLISQAIDVLRLAEAPYLADLAVQRRDRVTGALSAMRDRLDPLEESCLSFIESSLDLPCDRVEIPVRLVSKAPRPGCFTSRSDKTGAVCFVGLQDFDLTTLIEMVLHEATHALDDLSANSDRSVLDRLQRALDEAGLGSRRDMSQVRHSLIFVQAAETVRRFVDPAHIHYGVTHTYYERVPVAKIVLRHWASHLDGEIEAGAAIEATVSELATPGA